MVRNVQYFQNFAWIDIQNPQPEDLAEIAQEYKLNYYQIQDSLETGHLPKIEKHARYTFLILRAYTATPTGPATNVSELSNKIACFYSDKRIITIHKADFPFLKNIKNSYEKPVELLLYILHKMVGTYEVPANRLSDQIDELEKIVFIKNYNKVSLKDLYFLKTETRVTKRILQFTQNILNELEVDDEYKPSLEDTKDSVLSYLLTLEESSDEMNSLLNTYHSVSEKSNNDVMKLLTIFSAFFLPLTFIVGVYGMNFHYMPELNWKYGYAACMILMLIVCIVIYIWFKRKRII